MSFKIDKEVVAHVTFMKMWIESGLSTHTIRSTIIKTFYN